MVAAHPYESAAMLVGPIMFDEHKNVQDTHLKLNGAGLKKFINFKVVAVGFYLPQGTPARNSLTNIPKHLEVVYLLNVPKAELDHETERGIESNVNEAEFIKLRSRINQMNSYYQDVRKGDRIGVSYLPDVGTIVSFNGQVQGIVKGADFAQAFFSIWVGDNPVDKLMKRRLLGV